MEPVPDWTITNSAQTTYDRRCQGCVLTTDQGCQGDHLPASLANFNLRLHLLIGWNKIRQTNELAFFISECEYNRPIRRKLSKTVRSQMSKIQFFWKYGFDRHQNKAAGHPNGPGNPTLRSSSQTSQSAPRLKDLANTIVGLLT